MEIHPFVLEDIGPLEPLPKKYIKAMLVVLIDDYFPPFLVLASSTSLFPSPPPLPLLYLSLLVLALNQLPP